MTPRRHRLDATEVGAMLGALRPGVVATAVRVVERARCGDGVASTADRVRIELETTGEGSAELPRRMVVKTLFLHPLLRLGLPAILSLTRITRLCERLPLVGRGARSLLFVLVGLYQRFFPHAPDAMYENEVRFYTEVRPALDLEAPACFGGRFDRRSRRFGVLLEDLAERGVRFPNACSEVPVEAVRSLLGELARLHACFWRSPRFERDLAWVPTRLAGGMFPVFDGIGRELVRYQVDAHPFKRELLAPLGLSVDEMWEALWRSQRLLDAQAPPTLLHGDAHVGNSYLLPDGSGGLLDFQLSVRGHWGNDVSYLIVTALDADARPRLEDELLGHYLGELARHGVADPPTPEEAREAHRLAVIWGLVIGWLITPPVNYGEAITSANIERLVRAARELDSFGAVAEEDP